MNGVVRQQRVKFAFARTSWLTTRLQRPCRLMSSASSIRHFAKLPKACTVRHSRHQSITNRARLSEEQASEFGRRLLALIEEYFPPGKGDQSGIKYGFYGILTPIDLHPLDDSESKKPRPKDVALKSPPTGGLSACPQRRQASRVPQPTQMLILQTQLLTNTIFRLLILHILANHLSIQTHRIHTVASRPKMIPPIRLLLQIGKPLENTNGTATLQRADQF